MTDVDKASVAITVVTLLVVVVIGASVFAEVQATGVNDEYQQDVQAFEDYCTDRLGEDAFVTNEMAMGEHGGLHCNGRAGTVSVHFSQIPPDVLDAYARGESSASDVTASVEPLTPWWGVDNLAPVGVAGLVVLVVSVLIAAVQRYRGVTA